MLSRLHILHSVEREGDKDGSIHHLFCSNIPAFSWRNWEKYESPQSGWASWPQILHIDLNTKREPSEPLDQLKSLASNVWSRKLWLTAVGIRCADHATPFFRKFVTNFADKRLSLGRYSSLADKKPRSLVLASNIVCLSRSVKKKERKWFWKKEGKTARDRFAFCHEHAVVGVS
jgi:hypothetical protein